MQRLNKDLEKIRRQIEKIAPRAGNVVENYTHDAFKKAEWDGKPWKKRTSKDRSDRRQKDKPRALMVKTRALERSIQVSISNGIITVSTNIPYAQIHNEGGEISHPGGTPYVPFSARYTKRKVRGRIDRMGANQMLFLKKDGSYPKSVKFTRPHKITIPQRQFMGYSRELIEMLLKIIDDTFNPK